MNETNEAQRLREENERLKAELERERAERVKEWQENTALARNNVRLKAEVDELRRKVEQPPGEPIWQNAAKMYAKCSECPLGLDVRPGDLAPDHTFWGVKDKGQPRCEGVGRPTRAYRPVLDANGGMRRVDEFQLLRDVGSISSDKPAEPVPEVAPLPLSYCRTCGAQFDGVWPGRPTPKHGHPVSGLTCAGQGNPADAPLSGYGRARNEALAGVVGQHAEEIAALKERVRVSDEMRGALTERVSYIEQNVSTLEDKLAQARRDALGRDEVMSRDLLVLKREVDESVKALEGGAKTQTSAGGKAVYRMALPSRVAMPAGGKSMVEGWVQALNALDLPARLEVSEDNGRTWERCEE